MNNIENQKNQNQPQKSSYGKKSIWFWLVVYLLVGGLIYFLIYYFARGGFGY